ncbi:MAG: hypothetical protein PHS59_18140, partial [Paludibacter sp.]|nr:hypothetical protein [Paludibacter sp.]
MKNIIRKSAALILGFTLMVGTSVPSFAAIDTTKIQVATEMADKLSALDLFHGTENGYELEKTATRAESIAMLIRLLGEDGKIKKSGTVWNNFTDVPNWAKYYVEYAYSKGYSYGVSYTEFGASDKTTAAQYITLVLRSLGYDGSRDGYTWDNPFAFAETIGLI